MKLCCHENSPTAGRAGVSPSAEVERDSYQEFMRNFSCPMPTWDTAPSLREKRAASYKNDSEGSPSEQLSTPSAHCSTTVSPAQGVASLKEFAVENLQLLLAADMQTHL